MCAAVATEAAHATPSALSCPAPLTPPPFTPTPRCEQVLALKAEPLWGFYEHGPADYRAFKAVHISLLRSAHRTADAEQADLFYVPTCAPRLLLLTSYFLRADVRPSPPTSDLLLPTPRS